MRCNTKLSVAIWALAFGGAAEAQYYPRGGGQYAPMQPQYRPVTPGGYYPQQPATGMPGGFTTGNPSPYYDPNAVVGRNSGSSSYWDPYRGWVTNSQNTSVLNSATSPGRGPAPGTSIQTYNYWNGSQWVRGTRWMGQDGQWHGNHSDTAYTPNGSSTDSTIYYSAPQPSNTNSTIYSNQPSRPSYQPQQRNAPTAPSGYGMAPR